MNNITRLLAKNQLKQNRKRTIITIIGIVLSVSMLTAVCGFAVSGIEALRNLVGDDDVTAYQGAFISMATVLGVIIMIASIVVISNAFRVSASERTRQFGILKSVGATKQQIVKTVMYEARLLSVIAIPIGVGMGLLIQWLGTSIGDMLLAPLNEMAKEGLSLHMRFVFSWAAVLIAVLVSLVTLLLSAWLPARKAARIPAIEAIKMTQEIAVKNQRMHISRLVQFIFGFEGTLAAKSIKRSSKSYRAMVTAISISIILFLVCGNMDAQMTTAVNQTYNNIDANTITSYSAIANGTDPNRLPLGAQNAEAVTQALRQYPDTAVYGIGYNNRFSISADTDTLTDKMRSSLEPDQDIIHVSLVVPDREHYEALCREAGVALGSNILANHAVRVINGKGIAFQSIRFQKQTLSLEQGDTVTELPLHGQLTSAQIPPEILLVASCDIIVIVPDWPAITYLWLANSLDIDGYISYAEDTLHQFFPQSQGSSEYPHSVMDITAVTDMTRSLTKLITIFLYGFVGMLTLIGLTSVISAISANVRLRSREFAVLQSVGMTQGGIRRMLALESVMSSLKALLYGIPLGSAAMYLTFLAITTHNSFPFVYPWVTLLEVIAGVFLITLITTQYAAAKLRKNSSLMDAIRSTEGV